MVRLSLRKVVAAGAIATTAILGGTVAQAQPTINQGQGQCNNFTFGPFGGAFAGGSMGSINLAAVVPAELQLSCLVNVLGPNQGQFASQSATP